MELYSVIRAVGKAYFDLFCELLALDLQLSRLTELEDTVR